MHNSPGFFQTYGTLSENAPSYIERPADKALLREIENGELCLVLAPRQTGKSSLIVRTAAGLRKKGINTAIIHITDCGTPKKDTIWFGAIVNQIKHSLKLESDSIDWWKRNKKIAPIQRFANYLEDVVLKEIDGNVVLFFDEIDYALPMYFSDDFFVILRSIYNARAFNPTFKRLIFVLVGALSIDKLIKDRQRTPFNVGRSIELGDFKKEDLNKYIEVLGTNSSEAIERILYWTNGQPNLVQRLSYAYDSMKKAEKGGNDIDEIVKNTFLKNKEHLEKDVHFDYIQSRILGDKKIFRRLLLMYRDLLMGEDIFYDYKNHIQNELKLSGIVSVFDNELVVHNRIYQQIFDLDWVKENLPIDRDIDSVKVSKWVRRFLDKFNRYIKYVFILSPIIAAVIIISLNLELVLSFIKSPMFLFLIGIGIGVFPSIFYIKRRKEIMTIKKAELEAEQEFDRKSLRVRTDEERYRAALREELSHIDLLGSPDIESKTVKLEDAFVSLSISESWRTEERFHSQKKMKNFEMERYLTPEQVMSRAFKKNRLLLIIGDPGSGKTTLLKYYAVSCLDKKYSEFGFNEDVFPLYFPLRDLDFNKENNEPALLPQNLAKWSERHLLNISTDQFHDWLHKRKTLVLLDGLDEISSKEQRRMVCRWVKDMCSGLKNSCFVVTSRATGYRKLDGIELEVPHLRADIMDFSPRQQELFFNRWFRAVFLSQLPPEGMAEQEWKQQQIKHADQRSKTIIEFLNKEENRAVQELAAVPMLIHIMAIIWKDRDYLPKTRLSLYEAALNYLLEYRDRQKNIEPVLQAEEARRVLAPTALWMQEKLKKDEVLKTEMHRYMQPILNTLDDRPKAVVVCENFRDRAGLIADYDKDHYIFRHKSFREFLSALQLVKVSHQVKRIQKLVEYIKDDWWEESLRFFMSKSDDEIFDRFMQGLFKSKVSQELDAHRQTLLQHLVREAPQKKIKSLKEHLNSDSLNSRQRRYVMECLKTIGTPDAIKAIEEADKNKMDDSNRSYAEDILAEASAKTETLIEIPRPEDMEILNSFRNPLEGNVEYIKIPGGTYKYSASVKKVTVPDLYFCKYPVTNQRYRRFISFLAGKEKGLEKVLSLEIYAARLLKFADTIKEYLEYMGKNPGEWMNKFRSRSDDNKKFNGDDQAVVDISWYAARAYCFWLSCLHASLIGDKQLLNGDISGLIYIYRLPTEVEWEWAAGGEPDGSIRKYPWAKDKGEPDKNLANFSKNVGTTTPVDRYPSGVTPLGLMDMAGNVWEWMENLYMEDRNLRALRGGSWNSDNQALRCSVRNDESPDLGLFDVGFRVVRNSSVKKY
ncbi:MAG: SUMF1/EgtB/PvdO family nonheme iron enzyme [Candidatus Aminicenantes bacterium]|jgi:formylglycine-generating enzyme required for sulfatase activity/energy-coupling factor transporter ATP-binding protein EcfA2